jgi:hypothetical protein
MRSCVCVWRLLGVVGCGWSCGGVSFCVCACASVPRVRGSRMSETRSKGEDHAKRAFFVRLDRVLHVVRFVTLSDATRQRASQSVGDWRFKTSLFGGRLVA